MTKKLTTPRQIVKALGGPTKTAKQLGLSDRATPCNWYHRGITARYYLRIVTILEPKGYELSPKAFGILEPIKRD